MLTQEGALYVRVCVVVFPHEQKAEEEERRRLEEFKRREEELRRILQAEVGGCGFTLCRQDEERETVLHLELTGPWFACFLALLDQEDAMARGEGYMTVCEDDDPAWDMVEVCSLPAQCCFSTWQCGCLTPSPPHQDMLEGSGLAIQQLCKVTNENLEKE